MQNLTKIVYLKAKSSRALPFFHFFLSKPPKSEREKEKRERGRGRRD
jgi:hypothetical protein